MIGAAKERALLRTGHVGWGWRLFGRGLCGQLPVVGPELVGLVPILAYGAVDPKRRIAPAVPIG